MAMLTLVEAARKTGLITDTGEHDQPAETEVEAEIREFVRRDVVTNRERQPENESEMVASSSTPCCKL
jgi:hypothetical protein